MATAAAETRENPAGKGQADGSVVIKVGMVGDSQIGKTCLMRACRTCRVKYVEGSYDEDYIQTLGLNYMEKTISLRNTEITFSIWDLGGQREFVSMLPLVCNDAVAILFMFDLSRKSTLNSIKEWYRQARGSWTDGEPRVQTAIPFLVGTKFDHFTTFSQDEQEEITRQAKRFSKAMKAPLIFCSTSHSINVQKIFKIVLSKAFDLKCTIPEITEVGEPLLIYQDPAEVKEIKTFLEYARRKDARQVTIKKSAARKAGSNATVTKYKFKLRCSRYLYTFCLADSDKAEKLRQSLPPTLKVNDVDGAAKSKK
ncbi:Ras GTPase tem1 [Rhodotorula sphaerocarpa]